MKRSLKGMAVVLIMAVCATSFLPVAADTASATRQADALKAAGLFLGTGSGYNLPGLLTRDQGITVALRAQGMEAAVARQSQAEIDAVMAKVADVKDIPVWARPYVAFALKQTPAITTGVSVQSDGKVVFAPSRSMSGMQLITFLSRAMGYDTSLSTAPDIATAAKMLSAGQIVRYNGVAAMTRELAVDILYSTVTNGLLSGTGTKLINKLVSDGVVTPNAATSLGYAAPAATPTPTPAPTATATPISSSLAVVDVQAVNTKQVLVTFNQDVAKESVLAANYIVKEAGSTTRAVTPNLQADRRQVMLTIDGNASMVNFTTVDVTVKKAMKSAAGGGLDADFVKTGIPVQDMKVPALTGVEILGKRLLKLRFDKPVWDGVDNQIDPSNIQVKSNTMYNYVMSATANYAERSILVNLGTDLVAGSLTATVNANGGQAGHIRDFIGFMVQKTDNTQSFVPDTTEATAVVESVNRLTRVVTVKFNKPVYGTNARLYQMVKGVEAYGSGYVTKSEAVDTWEFTMPATVPSGNVSFYLVNSTTAGQQLRDLFGITVSDRTMVYNNIADTTAPVVQKITSVGNAGFDLTFNEALDMASAQTKANYEVRNASGVALTVTDASLLPDLQSVRLSVATSDLQSYTIKVTGVKDIEGNAISSWSATQVVEDTSNPKVTQAYAVPSQKKIFITFSEAMNTTDLGTKSNYLVDYDGGTNQFTSLGSSETVTVVDNRHIVLNLVNTITTPSVKMAAMRDQSGKKLGSDNTLEYSGESGNLTNIGPESVLLSKAELLSASLVRLTFNTRVSTINALDFQFRQDADGTVFSTPILIQAIQSIEVNADGQSEFVVKLDRDLNTDATWNEGGTRRAIEIQVASGGTVGSSGTPITAAGHAAAITLKDLCGGGIAVVSGVRQIFWNDFNADGKLDTVVVKYDEAILESSLSTVSFTVSGYTVAGVSIDSDGIVSAGNVGDHVSGSAYVILNITKANQTADAGTKPTVEQPYPIMDKSGNVIE